MRTKTTTKIPTRRTKRLPKPDDEKSIIGVNAPTSVRNVTAAVREMEALKLRITGATFAQIAETLQISEEGARQAVIRALEKTEEETKQGADYLRELERQRIERLILAATPRALGGDVEAINAARQLSESLRKMLGLDLTKTTGNDHMQIPGWEFILATAYGNLISNNNNPA